MEASAEPPISTSADHEEFVAIPDDQTLAETVTALERRGFSAEVVPDPDAARTTVLARIPPGSSVMTFPSVTLERTGIADAIDTSGRYESARSKGSGLDRATEMHTIKQLMALPEFALGSVQAITRDGTLVLASALGSQLAAHSWGAANVILVVGAQKLVPDVQGAHDRIYQHCLVLEDKRALDAYGGHSRVGKILHINTDDPGRIHVVLVRTAIGF